MSYTLNEDEYYFDPNGLMVFTEAYHLRRGYCCKSGCRHCPWQYKKTAARDPEENSSTESENHDSKAD